MALSSDCLERQETFTLTGTHHRRTDTPPPPGEVWSPVEVTLDVQLIWDSVHGSHTMSCFIQLS